MIASADFVLDQNLKAVVALYGRYEHASVRASKKSAAILDEAFNRAFAGIEVCERLAVGVADFK